MSTIINWLSGFLKAHNRNLDRPDGRALYAYQLQQTEFEFLNSYLSSCIDTVAGRHKWPSGTERLLVLYAAEWFRRRYDGGVWKWEDVFQSLDWPMLSAGERQKLAKDGLRYWQRDVFRRESGHAAYLMTVVTEGGFPMRLVNQENTHLSRYLKAVLSDYTKLVDTGTDAFKIAAAHGDRLPLSFRKDPVYQLAADTIEVVYEYANKLSDLNGQKTEFKNAFDDLEKHYPEWKNKLPILLESEGAQSLVNGLLKTAKKKQQAKAEFVFINRFFKMDPEQGDSWQHAAKVELPSVLSKELISNQIDVDDTNLPRRLELAIQFADSLVSVASMTRENEDYYVYPYGVDSLSLTLKPEDAVSCFVMAYDGGKLGELNLRGGAGLDLNLPLTCQMDNGRLNVIGTGTIRSALEFVYTCLPCDANIMEGSAEALPWNNTDFNGTWIKVEDRLRIGLAGGFKCTISPNTQSLGQQLCTVIGQRQYSYEAANLPCYAGFPKFKLWQGGHHTNVEKGQLYWSSAGMVANWKTAEFEIPKGEINYRIVIDDECIQSGKMVVLPEFFSVLLKQGVNHLEGQIEISGVESAMVVIDADLGVTLETVQTTTGMEVTCIAGDSYAGKVPLEIIWKDLSRATVYIPFPGQGAHFVDLNGTNISKKRQCLDDLIRLSAVAVCSQHNKVYELQGTLRANDIKGQVARSGLSFKSIIHQQGKGYYELPLVNVLTSIRNLFSYSADLDATVLLEIVADGGALCRIEIGQFSSELVFNTETRQVCHMSNSGELFSDRFDIQLVSLAGGQVPEIQTAVVNEENAYAYQFTEIASDISPCMAVMQGSAIRSVRPCIVFSTQVPAECSEDSEIEVATDTTSELASIFSLPTQWKRRKALDDYLQVIGNDAAHEGWSELLKAIRRFSEVHPDSLDLYEAIIDNPMVIAGLVYRMNKKDIAMLMTWEDYIPFRWWQIPIDSYINAFNLFKENILNQDLDIAEIRIENALGNLEKIRHFSPLSKATIEIVLTNCSTEVVEGIYNQVKGMDSRDLFVNHLDGTLKQKLFQTIGDSGWPYGLTRQDWQSFFNSEVAWLDQLGMGFRKPFLDAIIAQAYSIAFDRYLPRDYRAFICATREFNPQNFDYMMQVAVIVFYMSIHHGK